MSAKQTLGWSGDQRDEPTTFVMVRHGVTAATQTKLFSGSGGVDHPLVAEGEDQARRAAAWISRSLDVDAVVSSPLLRTRQTAGIVATEVGCDVEVVDGFAEAGFGDWDGHRFAQIMENWPEELQAWLASTAVAPPGGESFDAVLDRVRAARDEVLQRFAGQTVVVASHVTPIKMMAALALGAPIESIYRMELAPASITIASWWADGTPSLRTFSFVPE